MKTQNINQETGKGQVRKLTLRAGAVLLGAVLISLSSVNAQGLWEQFSGNAKGGKMAVTMDEQYAENKNADAAINAINSELADQLNHASESSSKLTSEETMEAENFLQDAEEYTAEGAEQQVAKYAEQVIVKQEKAEVGETEKGINDESNLNPQSAPLIVNMEEALEYHPEKFVNAEMSLEKENLLNGNTETISQAVEVESAPRIETLTNESQYNAEQFVEDEMENEIENFKVLTDFLELAEAYTAEEAEQQIAKYAENIVLNEKNLLVYAEKYTAEGADEEIAKYAELISAMEETENDNYEFAAGEFSVYQQ